MHQLERLNTFRLNTAILTHGDEGAHVLKLVEQVQFGFHQPNIPMELGIRWRLNGRLQVSAVLPLRK